MIAPDNHNEGHSNGDDGQNEEKENQESTAVYSHNLTTKLADASRFTPNPRSAGSVTVRYQKELNYLYVSLMDKMRKNLNKELSNVQPEPATIQMIEKLYNELFENIKERQMTIDKCYEVLENKGFRNNIQKPLSSHIVDLQIYIKDLEEKLKLGDSRRNRDCDQYSKLESKVRDLATELIIKEEKLKTKDEQETVYKDKIQRLELHVRDLNSELVRKEENFKSKVVQEKILEDKLKMAENESSKLKTKYYQNEMVNKHLLDKNKELMRKMQYYKEYISNHTDAEENLYGKIQISKQTQTVTDKHEEDNKQASPRPLQITQCQIKPKESHAENKRQWQPRDENQKDKSRQSFKLQAQRPSVKSTNVEEDTSNYSTPRAPILHQRPNIHVPASTVAEQNHNTINEHLVFTNDQSNRTAILKKIFYKHQPMGKRK